MFMKISNAIISNPLEKNKSNKKSLKCNIIFNTDQCIIEFFHCVMLILDIY